MHVKDFIITDDTISASHYSNTTEGELTIRMAAKPKSDRIGTMELKNYQWKSTDEGGVLVVKYSGGNEIPITR